MAYLLGIDAGTSSVKAALFDEEKGEVTSAYVECAASYENNGCVELDMEKYWNACKECISTISKKSKLDFKDLKALAISSQGVTFVPVDKHGNELGRGIVYYDTRAQYEAGELIRQFGEDKLFEVTGQPVIWETFEAPKLLWIRKHEPDRFRNIYKILLVHDYLVYKLTGNFICVPPLISSSLLFDIRHKKWWEEMLDFLKLSPEKLPRIYQPGEPAGHISKKASTEIDISPKTLVVAGAIDQTCGMIGVGNIRPGLISESTGSFLAIHTVSCNFFDQRDAGIYNFCNAVENTYALIGVCPTAGSAFNWFKNNFCEKEKEYAEKTGSNIFELLIEKAEKIPAGSDGLIMLPYLSGKGSPGPSPLAKGIYYGFKLHHKKEHFVRALIESIAYMLKSNIDVFKENGFDIKEIRSFGGGSQSKIWNQIKADVCKLPIVTCDYSEPGCLGAAIIAGVGCGIYKSIEEGSRRLVVPGKHYYPDAETSSKYENYYGEFMKFNEIMKSMY